MKNRLITLFFLGLLIGVSAQDKQHALWGGFQQPPASARPQVWWHWVNGNVTKSGITKDLEWMARIGIGGFQAFDVIIGGGQAIENKVRYRSAEWYELIRHAASEADRLGLEMTLVTAAGWSETGGTWVLPHQAMKKLVSSSLQIKGGIHFKDSLPHPPVVNGPIRNLRKTSGRAMETLYEDIRVLAYNTQESIHSFSKPLIKDHHGDIKNSEALLDDNLETQISLQVPEIGKSVFLEFVYDSIETIRSFRLGFGDRAMFPSRIIRPYSLQVSDNGVDFRTFFSQTTAQHDIRALPVRTVSFPQISGKVFRVVFDQGSAVTTVGGPDDIGGFGMPATPPENFYISEAIFSPLAQINRWEDKANFAPLFDSENFVTPNVPSSSAIQAENIIDLTSRFLPDGTLDWIVPEGNWTVMRFGYSLTGATNGPAAPDATGFEVDKLNATHLKSYMEQWSKPIQEALGPLYGKSFKHFLVDSYEADAQNWTEDFITEFHLRRGYDMIPYLPVLQGIVIDSAEVSDRFLWDFRLTLAELLTENHYKAITEIAHEKGIQTYGEVAGISLPIIQDALRNKSMVDIPMAEFGMGRGLGSTQGWISPLDLESHNPYSGAYERLNAHQADVREAASAAHIYGKRIVAAESWTGGGFESPAEMVAISDYWMTQGINQIIFHTSAHQPLDTKPGNTMVGTHFHRNITWAEQAKPFVTYLTRNQFMLQEGRFMADIAFFLGEDIPVSVPYWKKLDYEIPEGYDYDFINPEVLFQFTVENGELVLPTGMSYKILVLPNRSTMTLPVLEKIKSLVAAGATIVGAKPEKSPSLYGYPQVDQKIKFLANEIWGPIDGTVVYQNTFGNGSVFWNIPLKGILAGLGVYEDFQYTKPSFDTRFSWIHRKTSEVDYYFVHNIRAHAEEVRLKFRVTGKKPELWYPDSGIKREVEYKIGDGYTTLTTVFEPQESVFVVFSEPTEINTRMNTMDTTPYTAHIDMSKGWLVSFPVDSENTKKITMDSLISWTSLKDFDLNHFSGTVSYTKTFNIEKEVLNTYTDWILMVKDVKDIAVVSLNGVVLDTLWKSPFKVNLSHNLKAGTNELKIQVTNQWDNRLVGDALLPEPDKKLSITGGTIFGRFSLKPSGIFGPVLLLAK